MSRQALIIASVVGLVLAIAEGSLIPVTLATAFNTAALSFFVAVMALLVGVIGGRLILGRRSAHRYYRLAVPVFAAISAFAFESAVTNWLISQQVLFGPPPSTLTPEVIVAIVIGAISYLVAAFLYGFAGQRQGVAVGARTGLLLILLLAVLPFVNALGMIGFLITAFTRKPAPATGSTTPERPAASE